MSTISFFPNYYFENKQSIDGVTRSLYKSEIFEVAQCLLHEQSTVIVIENTLKVNGYSQSSYTPKVWSNGKKTVILSLVDDFRQCALDMPPELIVDPHNTPRMFDQNTLVITDNFIGCPTLYPVLHVPRSFFGIYNYTPKDREFVPEKDMFFSVNRIDQCRMLLYFEFLMTYDSLEKFSQSAYINFNCAHAGNRSMTLGQRNNFFNELWGKIDNADYIKRYKKYAEISKNNVPYINYSHDYDDMFYRSWLNVVIETYSNDYVIAFSEKIFRALLTPVPWVLHGAPHSVTYLKSLGFDVLDDIVDHYKYDADMLPDHKLSNLANESIATVKKLKTKNFSSLANRCKQASRHNAVLLNQLSHQWAEDFSSWIPKLINFIS